MKEEKKTVETKFYIASNKYSLQERQTKRGKVYDIMFRIIDPVSLVERQKKISGFSTKAKAKEAYVDFVTTKCEIIKVKPVRTRDTSKRDPSIDELIQEYISTLSNQNKASSIYAKKHIYRIFVSPFFGSKTPKDLTKEALYQRQDQIWQMKNKRNDAFILISICATFAPSSVRSLHGVKEVKKAIAKRKQEILRDEYD